jgi:outer membrane protein assembly factor BamB
MMSELGVFPHNLATCAPLLVGDVLFVVTSNGVDEGHIDIPAPGAPSFLALDAGSGKVLWKSNLPGKNILHGQWSNPAYTVVRGEPQVIFPGGDGWLYSFAPKSGELLWKFDCNPKSARYTLGGDATRNDFLATPVVWENKLYIGVGQDPEHRKGVGHLWCIDITRKPANKDRDLSPFSDPKDPNPTFDPTDPRNRDSGLVWHYGGEDNTPDAPRDWYFCRTLSTCAVHEGLCYEADLDGMFFCFDARTGKVLWSHDLQGDTWSSPYVVDGKVYIGNEKGVIHIFAHGRTKKIVNKIRMGRTARVRTPVIACNGVLYVVSENPCRLWAIAAVKD